MRSGASAPWGIEAPSTAKRWAQNVSTSARTRSHAVVLDGHDGAVSPKATRGPTRHTGAPVHATSAEGPMVVEVSPVGARAPEERVHIVGGRQEDIARADAPRVKAVGRVIDGPRREGLFVAEAEAERMKTRELAGDPAALLSHDAWSWRTKTIRAGSEPSTRASWSQALAGHRHASSSLSHQPKSSKTCSGTTRATGGVVRTASSR